MPILGLHHAQITIPSDGEAQARAFYGDVLGLREIEKPASLAGRGGFWLAVGRQELHVGLEEGVDRLATRAHVAFLVEDLDDLQAGLGCAGFETKAPPAIPGYRRIEMRDPFGNRLELLQAVAD